MKKILLTAVAVMFIQIVFAQSGDNTPPKIYTSNQRLSTGFYNQSLMNFFAKNKVTEPAAFGKFVITLTNDSTLTVWSKIINEEGENIILIGDHDERYAISPRHTKEIQFNTSMEDKALFGVPTDSCWLFKTIHGALFGYSNFPDAHREFIAYFRIGDEGDFFSLTKENLLAVINTPRAQKLLSRGKLTDALVMFNREIEATDEE